MISSSIPSIPWIELFRFGLLIAAAGFSFLIWRWNHFDSRTDREELIRNRYVKSEVVFLVPENATANDTHYRFSLFRVRVQEEGGLKNFYRKIRHADFQGTTEFSISSVYDIGRDQYESLARGAAMSPMSTPPRQKEQELPDKLSKITEKEEYRELGLDDQDLSISGTTFSITLHTADPKEVDDQIDTIFGVIDEVYDDSN